jgi:hypothetical protein
MKSISVVSADPLKVDVMYAIEPGGEKNATKVLLFPEPEITNDSIWGGS